MSITAVDKIKINKYLKECSIDYLSYLDMCDALGKRGKISHHEFLDYFTDYVVSEFRKNDKISIKNLTKVVSIVQSFLVWMDDSEIQISEETLDKIRSFKELYEEYLVRSGVEENLNFKNDYIEHVLKTVNDLYPSEKSGESVSKYINRIGELEEDVKKLNQQLSGVSSDYEQLVKSYDKKSTAFAELKEKTKRLKDDLKSKNKEILSLYNRLEDLTGQIDEMGDSLSTCKGEISRLTVCEAELSIENALLRESLRHEEFSKAKSTDLQTKQLRIQELLYQKLLSERVSINGLLEYVQSSGISSDVNEIQGLLNRMGNKLNIDNGFFSVRPMYQIVQPNLLRDGKFLISIPNDCRHFDVMVVSDFHIVDFNNMVLKYTNELNDYCVKNGINLILNLGDFYDGVGGKFLNYESAVNNYNIIEQTVDLYPKADGLYHAILGGNHDMNISNYGYDPVRILAEAREDFINLGYIHSTILLNGSLGEVGSFDIHHPYFFGWSVNMSDDGIDMKKVTSYLDGVYSKQNRDRSDSYIDIFGHIHRSQFNVLGAYCYVPPYFKNGASHFRFYFDENTRIKYMVCMPLVFGSDKKLTKTNEIIYQKKLDK